MRTMGVLYTVWFLFWHGNHYSLVVRSHGGAAPTAKVRAVTAQSVQQVVARNYPVNPINLQGGTQRYYAELLLNVRQVVTRCFFVA